MEFSNPRHWCRPSKPDEFWVKRYALACRNYVIQQVQRKHPEIAYQIMCSNVFHYTINTLDPEFPGFRCDMMELDNAMTAALAIINDPAMR